MKHVIKRRRHTEAFDSRKLYASIYASCLSVHETEKAAEMIAQEVTKEVVAWLKSKSEITSGDIRHHAGQALSEINPHAGYFYLHHRIIW